MRRVDVLVHAAEIATDVRGGDLARAVATLFDVRENKLGDALCVCAMACVLMQPNDAARFADAVIERTGGELLANAGSIAGACPSGPALAEISDDDARALVVEYASVLLCTPARELELTVTGRSVLVGAPIGAP